MMNDVISALIRLFILVIVVVLSFFLLMFITQNGHNISIYFDFLKSSHLSHLPLTTLPVWSFTLMTFATGALLGAFFMWYRLSELREAYEEEQNSNKKLKNDMNSLKSKISKTVS